MELYGKYSKSIPQKITVTLLEIIFLYFAYWVLFQNGGDWIQNKTGIFNASENISRRIIIYLFNLVVFFRILFLMIFLLKRKISWDEAFGISSAFLFYYVAFLFFVLPSKAPIDLLDYVAIGIFVIGSILNTGGEYLRDIWKKNPSNKGKIYTKGFFKY